MQAEVRDAGCAEFADINRRRVQTPGRQQVAPVLVYRVLPITRGHGGGDPALAVHRGAVLVR